MSASALAANLFSRIKLPDQDLDALSFCPSNRPQDVSRWAESLPATRVNHTSVILYKALPEISRLKTKVSFRLAMLESLRPYVQRCIQGLAQSFLNKPVVLPDDAMKAAIVALALQKHITQGYSIVARDIACNEKLNNGDPQSSSLQPLALSLHRAVTGLGTQLMRSYQLYARTTPGIWLTLHSLHQVAKASGVDQLAVNDELLSHVSQNSTRDAYFRVLLLASANPNKLRQFDVSTAYKLLELWTGFVQLEPNKEDNQAVYSINMQADRAPSPKSLIPPGELPDCIDIQMGALLAALETQRNLDPGDKSIIDIPKGIPSTLLNHIIDSWSTNYHRAHERMSYQHEFSAVVGVTSIHFHLCEGTPFENFLLQSGKANLHKEDNPYLKDKSMEGPAVDDPWAKSFDAGGAGRNFDPLLFSTLDIESQMAKRESQQAANKYPEHIVRSEDRSQSGYCLQWKGDVPKSLKSGELMALREVDASTWTIAIIRWVSQSRGVSSFGIELMSSLASPFGASIIHKSGDDADFMRAFLLPEQKARKIKSCLLTPSVPFQEGQKVKLNRRGEKITVQLTRKIMDSGSISQFQFRQLEGG